MTNFEHIYRKGLNREKETVISDHYIYKHLKSAKAKIYSQNKLDRKTLYIDTSFINEHLIPSLFASVNKFIHNRVQAAINRAKNNYFNYGKDSPEDLSASDFIAEAMFDRQFLRGPKRYSNRKQVSTVVQKQIEHSRTIEMVMVALPFKSSSIIKCRGPYPDLAEVDFLISLYALTEIVSRIYQTYCDNYPTICAKFNIITDGFRFNQIVNYSKCDIHTYQSKMIEWIKILNLEERLELRDYQLLFKSKLPDSILEQKQDLYKKSIDLYVKSLGTFSDHKSLASAVDFAIKNEPDPEYSQPEGRFFPLFKSLLFTMEFTTLREYCNINGLPYSNTYLKMVNHLLIPFGSVKNREKELLRLSMLDEAWQAAIQYIAEIKSDRDLPNDPILLCSPEAIRWTIHPKPGQLALLISTPYGDPVLPWHGTSIFKTVNNKRMRLYSLPTVAIESMDAKPVFIKDLNYRQPFFYIDADIPDIHTFQNLLSKHFTYKRKS